MVRQTLEPNCASSLHACVNVACKTVPNMAKAANLDLQKLV